MHNEIRFANPRTTTFYSDLTQSVNEYFKARGISKNANATMYAKSAALLLLYFIPYTLILALPLTLLQMWLLCIPMGFALAGIGMGVMHDACHGSYSSKRWVNRFMSYSMNLIGGNKYNWSIQHNVKHHTYTNIFNADEDLDNGNVIRLSPYSEYRWFHKYQHIYSWFLYTLGTLSWVTIKDFKQFKGIIKEDKKGNFKKEVFVLILSKILYYGYMVAIPYFVLNIGLGYILIGFLTIHFIAGIVLSVTFQLAHVVDGVDHHHSKPPEAMQLEDSWAIHQIKTTANFARRNSFLNWYLGGLNFQVEHHLFPNVCHVHYREVSQIVKDVVEKHGLTYNEFPTLGKAIKSHYNTLKAYSKKD